MPTGSRRAIGGALLFLSCSVAYGGVTLRTAAQMGSEPKFIDNAADHEEPIKGLCVDLFRAIEQVDPSLRFVGDQSWQPASRIEHLLKSGHLDVACALVRSAAREKQMAFVEPPLFVVNYHLAVRADDTVQIKTWDDVRKLAPNDVILANHGWGHVNQLQEEVPGLHVDSSAYTLEANLSKLLAGRGRFYYYREPGLSSAITRAGFEGRVRVLPLVMNAAPVYLALGNALPESTVIIVRQALARLASNGDLARLATKWNLSGAPKRR